MKSQYVNIPDGPQLLKKKKKASGLPGVPAGNETGYLVKCLVAVAIIVVMLHYNQWKVDPEVVVPLVGKNRMTVGLSIGLILLYFWGIPCQHG